MKVMKETRVFQAQATILYTGQAYDTFGQEGAPTGCAAGSALHPPHTETHPAPGDPSGGRLLTGHLCHMEIVKYWSWLSMGRAAAYLALMAAASRPPAHKANMDVV